LREEEMVEKRLMKKKKCGYAGQRSMTHDGAQ